MLTATPNPSFAPSTNTSYTGTRLAAPASRNTSTSVTMAKLPASPIQRAATSGGNWPRPQSTAPMAAPNAASGTSRRACQIGRRCTTATASRAASSEIDVATSVGSRMSAALKPASPCFTASVWRIAITEVGISVSPAVLSTMKRICASVARAGC
ncbi:MAG: hypothetical protein BWX79_02721 [Alphaproteobacteria bacterium ADurb.Bin100]|nr:MAG: hypothetical protein BWX79_02721 [Alphaproteobacteria bacterium ADurb.Bin100]